MNTNQKDPGCCTGDGGCCGNITAAENERGRLLFARPLFKHHYEFT
jgi:hypothetical protein